MQKRALFCAVAVLSAAIVMTAGCATQDVVKIDEGVVSAPVARQTDQQKSTITSAKQDTSLPASESNPRSTPSLQSQNESSIARLQSALEKIYFDFDSANLSASARNTLTKNAAVLMKEPTAKIRIEGNCDERGSAEYNLALGERRANAAKQYLKTLGVKPDRLSVISYGKEKPAVLGNDESAMAKNRRDEFLVLAQ